MSANDFLLGLVGLASGFFFSPLTLLLIKPLVDLALRPLGGIKLPVTTTIFSIAAFTFLLFSFFALAWVQTKFLGLATDENWKEVARVWGRMWFVGFVLYGLIPIIERRLRQRSKAKGGK